MKKFLFILSMLFAAVTEAQGNRGEKFQYGGMPGDSIPRSISASVIQGGWVCVEVIPPLQSKKDTGLQVPSMVMFDDMITPYATPVTIDTYKKTEQELICFRGDTAWYLSYPCELYSGQKFRLALDSIFIMTPGEIESGYQLLFLKDTLLMTGSPYQESCKYIRYEIDSFVLQSLIRDTVNSECLLTSWVLVSEEGQGDIAESWKDYPFTPSDVLQIHRKNLVSKNNNKELVIRMGWKKRHFRYTVTTLGGHRAIKLELLDKTRENGSPYTFYYRQSY